MKTWKSASIALVSLTLAAPSLAVLATPAASLAANACEKEKAHTTTMGTIFGALGGAALGAAIAAHGHQTDGALVGAAGGAVVGNQLARSKKPCPDGYVYREAATPPPYEGEVAYRREAPPPPAGYWREDVRSDSYDRYGRACTMRTESYYDPDGRYVSRQMERCD